MRTSRTELRRQLAKLDLDTPEINMFYPDPYGLISEFAGHANSIAASAGHDDYEWALAEVNRILVKHGHAPENEKVPLDKFL